MRNLSIEGKILVFKTLSISKLVLMLFLIIKVVKVVKIQKSLIWDDSSPKIN